jgi:uncharacterized membrane protein YoaK (UPF0700 family)
MSADVGTIDRATTAAPTSNATRDWLLAGLSFASGAYEALAFLTFGHVFTAFQTGNLIFLGMGLGGTEPPAGPELRTVATSLVSFVVGGAAAIPLLRGAGSDDDARPWAPGVTAALCLGVVVQVLFGLTWMTASSPTDRIGVLVALGAFAMGVQMNAVRSLGVAGISTTAFTAAVADVAGRIGGKSLPADTLRRLLMVIVALVAGGLSGTLMLRHLMTWAPLVPLGAELVVLGVAALGSDRAASAPHVAGG